jgi:hypothetical protein
MSRRANLLLTACAAVAVALGAPTGVLADSSQTDRNNPQPYAVADPTVFTDPLVVQDMNNGTTAPAMAQSLLGGGVTISNVVYTGAPNAAGLFSGGAGSDAIIGFDSGIVMGSGSVQTVAPHNTACNKGVEGPNQCTANTTINGTPGDPDLTALSGKTTFDAAVLQFDFIPQFNTVSFQYVFSSDEYNEFANTIFNDTFGFLVNGVNCALVPGTSLPVGVNTINGGNPIGTNPQHPQYFRDNDPATRPVAINTEMDGLTTVLTCNATVNAGASNHIKLAIADASDAAYDSNVFIAGGSLISGTQVSTTLSGGGQSGASITVPQGTAVTDSATLSGANAASASGTVHYQVYSDTNCDLAHKVADAGTKTVSNGLVPNSDAVTFSQAGTFSWQASYSGDSLNNPTINSCGSETVTVTVSVSEQPITAQGTAFNSTEGAVFTGAVATFTDPNTSATAAEYSATIDWGDLSAPSAGTIGGSGGNFTVSGVHTYAEEGTYTVTVTITDVDITTNTAKATSTANVTDAALTAKPACSATSLLSYNGPTATFTDAASPFGTLSDFSATINWGDGTTTAGTVTGADGGPYTVSGSHTYATTGNFLITTTINDVGGSTVTTSCNTLGFTFAPGGGSFVIGDKNAAIGTSVTFWGAQWAKLNSLSGGTAPASFKGFAEAPLTPACGIGWSFDPGNSTPPPPGPLPAFMGVIVTSSASMHGTQTLGNTVHIVVVKTNPGYAPDPGHPGTGTVVATVC